MADLEVEACVELNPMKLKFLLLMALITVGSATARAAEVAAESPPGAQVEALQYRWGRELNGLQIGIQMPVPGEVMSATKPVPLGTVVTFVLAVRNTGKAPRTIEFSRWMWSDNPRVTDEAGQPLGLHAQAKLFGAARNGQSFQISKTLAPAEIAEFKRNVLAIGVPDDKFKDPVLDVAPGKYRVRYFHDFDPDYHQKAVVTDPKTGEKSQLRKNDEDVNSAEILIEIAPAAPVD